MIPADQFCPNHECSARDQLGEGNIVIHSRKEKRYLCKVCNRTFAATKGTTVYLLLPGKPKNAEADHQLLGWRGGRLDHGSLGCHPTTSHP